MTTFLTSERNVIGRLRVKGAVPDPLAARLRLESWLGAADLHPRGLPPSAIVCVRRLRAPRVALSARGGGAHEHGAWQRLLADTLGDLAARAARPVEGPVPPTAEAVVFADRAELLACLALDWRAGVPASARWWWRSLLKGADIERALLSEWLGAPAHVPAALEHLARAGRAAEFAGALAAGEARALTERVAEVFALEELRAALGAATADDGAEELAGAGVVAASRDDGRTLAARAATLEPPWRRFVRESRAGGIGREQECLLGVGLTLARAPSHARSSRFARDVREWRVGTAAASGAEGDFVGEPSAAGDERVAPAAQAARPAGDRPEAATPRMRVEGRSSSHVDGAAVVARAEETPPAPPDVGADAEAGRGMETAKPGAESHAPTRRRAARDERARTWPSADDVLPAPAVAAPNVNAEPESSPPPYLLEARVETRLGGLFYLINVGLFLELYGDFTTPLRPGLALSAWDFVALLGRRLCGADGAETDAVWALLARLAGRDEGEPPGLDFEPPDEWRVPPAWLAPFPEAGTCRWSTRGGRLRVRHHAGFMLLDVPLGGTGAPQKLREEMAAYDTSSGFELRREAAPDEPDASPLERWAERLTAYVGARLCRALGAGATDELARLLFAREARVSVTATHVEVLLRLAELPIEVRLAGLDRDPGWVPAAGRSLAFRFE